MSRELVQAGTFDIELDWDAKVAETKALVNEDAELTATIDDAMVRRFHGRVKIGLNLIELQEVHSRKGGGSGDFSTVELPRLGITDRTFAHRCIRVAKLFQNLNVASLQHSDFFDLPMSMDTWNQLASPSGEMVVQQLEAGNINPTQEAIAQALQEEKAKRIAEKQRADEAKEAARKAQEEAKLAQQQLFDAQSTSSSQIEELNQRIEAFEEQIKAITTPEKETIYEDTSETKDELLKLKAKVRELTTQRDNLAQENKELSADLDVEEAKHEEEARILRVRQEWQRSADAMHKSIVRFMGQLPMPLDTQLFESDDWAMLEQVEETFQRGIEACRKVHRSTSYMVIDAG